MKPNSPSKKIAVNYSSSSSVVNIFLRFFPYNKFFISNSDCIKMFNKSPKKKIAGYTSEPALVSSTLNTSSTSSTSSGNRNTKPSWQPSLDCIKESEEENDDTQKKIVENKEKSFTP